MQVVLRDRDGNEVASLDTKGGPYEFELQTTSGMKNYKLSFIPKRTEDGGKDPTKIKGAMLQ